METFATPYPVVYNDGEQDQEKGVVGIHSVLTFKRFQFLISQKVGLSATQLSAVFICRRTSGDGDKRQKLPINESTNFNIILNQHNPSKEKDCYFLVVQKKSKKERKGPRRRQTESMPGDHDEAGSGGDVRSSPEVEANGPDSVHHSADVSSPPETTTSSPACSLPSSPHLVRLLSGNVKDGQGLSSPGEIRDKQEGLSVKRTLAAAEQALEPAVEGGTAGAGVQVERRLADSCSAVENSSDEGQPQKMPAGMAHMDPQARGTAGGVESSLPRDQILQRLMDAAAAVSKPGGQAAGGSWATLDDSATAKRQLQPSLVRSGRGGASWQQMEGLHQGGQGRAVLERPGSVSAPQEQVQRSAAVSKTGRDVSSGAHWQEQFLEAWHEQYLSMQNERVQVEERIRGGSTAGGMSSVPARLRSMSPAVGPPQDPFSGTGPTAGRTGGASGLPEGLRSEGLSVARSELSGSGAGAARVILRSSGGPGVIGPRSRAGTGAAPSVGVIGPKQANGDQASGYNTSLFGSGSVPAGRSPFLPSIAQTVTSSGLHQPSLAAIHERAAHYQQKAHQSLYQSSQYRGLSQQDLLDLNGMLRGLANSSQGKGTGQRICSVCNQRLSNPAAASTFHWCVDDRVVVGFRGPSPAGPIQRPLKRHVETAA